MQSLGKFVIASFVIALLAAAGACQGAISDAEIDQMCQKRLALEGDRADDIETRTTKCKEDAAQERVVKRIFECRMKAANLDVYWNSCR